AAAREKGPAALKDARAPWALDEFLGKGRPSPGAKLAGAEPDVIDALAHTARRLVRELAAVDEEGVAAVVEAATPLARTVRESLLRAGRVTFDGLLRLTRDLLAFHPEVRRGLARRYRAILLDEFQDTDPLQYEILF